MNSFLRQLNTHIAKRSENFDSHPKKAIGELIFWCGKQFFKSNKEPITKDNKLTVAFQLLGGVGDICCNIEFITQFAQYFPKNTPIDIYTTVSQNIAQSLFYNLGLNANFYDYNKFKENQYNLVLIICRFPEIVKINHNVVKNTAPEVYSLLEKYQGYMDQHPYFFHNGTTDDFLGNAYSMLHGAKRWQQADILHLLPEQKDTKVLCELETKDVLNKFDLENKNFITIHRGTGQGGDKIRCWSLENYEKLAKLLKNKYPDYALVQVGSETDNSIPYVDIDLRGKTTFPEIKVLLKNSALHIDCEGGLVHLRHWLDGRKSVVLFGPTRKEFYGYDENINIQTGVCDGCEWLTMDWRETCPKGCAACECFSSITPEMIMNEIETKGL